MSAVSTQGAEHRQSRHRTDCRCRSAVRDQRRPDQLLRAHRQEASAEDGAVASADRWTETVTCDNRSAPAAALRRQTHLRAGAPLHERRHRQEGRGSEAEEEGDGSEAADDSAPLQSPHSDC